MLSIILGAGFLYLALKRQDLTSVNSFRLTTMLRPEDDIRRDYMAPVTGAVEPFNLNERPNVDRFDNLTFDRSPEQKHENYLALKQRYYEWDVKGYRDYGYPAANMYNSDMDKRDIYLNHIAQSPNFGRCKSDSDKALQMAKLNC